LAWRLIEPADEQAGPFRHSGARRNPDFHAERKYTWMPASAGMTNKDKTLQAGARLLRSLMNKEDRLDETAFT